MRTTLPLLALACFLASTPGCGGGGSSIDPAEVDAAPKKYKDACHDVCTTAEEVRTKGCGQVQYGSYSDCYNHCVDDYVRRPQCETIFNDANDCLNQYVCQAGNRCLGQIAVAAACRDGKFTPPPAP